MFILFIIFLVIIIIQIIYTYYLPSNIDDNLQKSNTTVEFNKQNKERLVSLFHDILNTFSYQINSGEYDFDAWYENVKKNKLINVDDNEYYIYVYEKIKNTDQYIELISYGNEENISLNDFIEKNKDYLLNTKFSISDDIAENMFYSSTIGNISNLQFYWIDQIYHYSVMKDAYFTKWKSKDGREGIIGSGMSITSLSYESLYKYITYIHKPELLFVMLIVFIFVRQRL